MGLVKEKDRPGHLLGRDTSTEVSFVPTVFEVKCATPDFLQIYSNAAKVIPGSRAVPASAELVAAYYAYGYKPLAGTVIVDLGFADDKAQEAFWGKANEVIDQRYPHYRRTVLNPPGFGNTRAAWGRRFHTSRR